MDSTTPANSVEKSLSPETELTLSENSLRLVKNVDSLLSEGLFRGSQHRRISEARAYVGFLREQAEKLVEDARQRVRAEKKSQREAKAAKGGKTE